MKNIVDAAREIHDMLRDCSNLVYMNKEHFVDYYDSFSFDILVTLISTYRLFKQKYTGRYIYARSRVTQRHMYYTEPYYSKDGIYIRAIYEDISNTDEYIEFDTFIIRYISKRFDYPIHFINSYIKINYFIGLYPA